MKTKAKVKATPKKPVSPYSGAVKAIRSMDFNQRQKFFEEAGKIHATEQQHAGDGQDPDGSGYDTLQEALDKE